MRPSSSLSTVDALALIHMSMHAQSRASLLLYPAFAMLGAAVAWTFIPRPSGVRQFAAAPSGSAPEALARAPAPGVAPGENVRLRRVHVPSSNPSASRITIQPLTEQGSAAGRAAEVRPSVGRWIETLEEPDSQYQPEDIPPWNLVAWDSAMAASGLRWIVPAVDEVLLATPATQRRSMRLKLQGLDARACTLVSSHRPSQVLAPHADGRFEWEAVAETAPALALYEGDSLVAVRRLDGDKAAQAHSEAAGATWDGRVVVHRFEIEPDRGAESSALHLRWTPADGRSAFEVGRRDSPAAPSLEIKLLAGCTYDYILWADGCEPSSGSLVAQDGGTTRHRLALLSNQAMPVAQVLDPHDAPAVGAQVAMLPITTNPELGTDLLVRAAVDEFGLARAVLPASLRFEVAVRTADGGWARTVVEAGQRGALPVMRLRRAHRVQLALRGGGTALEPFCAGPLEWRVDRLDGAWSGSGILWPPWTIGDLPAGEANLHLRLAGGTWSGSVCIEIGAHAVPVGVTMEPAPEVTGVVVDGAGVPIAGAVVQLGPDSWSVATRGAFGTSVCDASGRFRVRLPGGAACSAQLLCDGRVVDAQLLEAGQEVRWSIVDRPAQVTPIVDEARN